MLSNGCTSFGVLLLSPYQSSSLSLCMVSDAISSNIDEVLSINPSAIFFVVGDLDIHHKDWLTYSGKTDKPGDFSISNNLLGLLTFLLGFLTVILTVLLLLATPVFVLQWLSFHWKILIMLLPQFRLTSSKEDAPFH